MNILIGDEEEILCPGLKQRSIRAGRPARNQTLCRDVNGPFRDESGDPGSLGGADTCRDRDVSLKIQRAVDRAGAG